MSDDKRTDKIQRAANQFKFAVVHVVQQHITEKYTGVCHQLASVDDLDYNHA